MHLSTGTMGSDSAEPPLLWNWEWCRCGLFTPVQDILKGQCRWHATSRQALTYLRICHVDSS